MIDQPKNDGRTLAPRILRALSAMRASLREALREAALWTEIQPSLRAHLESLTELSTDVADRASFHARRVLARSFETRLVVAVALVVASAGIGYELGGLVIGGDSEATSEAIDDALAHAEHAFALDAGEAGILDAEMADLEAGELIAQYAPVSIDALPIHDSVHDPVHDPSMAGRLLASQSAPEFENTSSTTVQRVSARTDELTLVTRGEIAKQESLASSLRRQGISPAAIHLVSTELRKVFDFRKSRAGDSYRLTQDPDGRVLDFQYSQGLEESYSLAWKGTRYVARRQTEMLEPQVAKIAGVVDGSFYDAIMALGEQSSLATEFAKILAWDMDFSRHVQQGDEFSILYERLYTKAADGRAHYVRPGRILAGRYKGQNGEHTVVYYEDGKGQGAYFRPDGSSVERAFLAAPLEFSKITSRFTNARRHPILNITRPHPGIDYAAPYGTPIFSVSDGVVEFRARAGASGNLVRIRHSGGYTSHYAHLSSFARNLKVGDKVRQKQIIGYVGSTGLSTGPHVCFRVKKNGQYVDPMRMGKPAGPSLEGDRIARFRDIRDRRLADLGQGPFIAANEAL